MSEPTNTEGPVGNAYRHLSTRALLKQYRQELRRKAYRLSEDNVSLAMEHHHVAADMATELDRRQDKS